MAAGVCIVCELHPSAISLTEALREMLSSVLLKWMMQARPGMLLPR